MNFTVTVKSHGSVSKKAGKLSLQDHLSEAKATFEGRLLQPKFRFDGPFPKMTSSDQGLSVNSLVRSPQRPY